jgi:excisionase family DNA binding protein
MDVLLLTAEEAAQALGVGRSTVFRLMQAGELRGVRIGHSRRFAREEVEAFVAKLREVEAVSV